MFDEVSAQRLDRLERGASRRKWDSAMMSAAQRSQLEQAGAGCGSTPSPPASGDQALVDLLTERFDRLERKYESLEWRLGRVEQRRKGSRRARMATAAAVLGFLILAGLGIKQLTFGGQERAGGSSGAAVAARTSEQLPPWPRP